MPSDETAVADVDTQEAADSGSPDPAGTDSPATPEKATDNAAPASREGFILHPNNGARIPVNQQEIVFLAQQGYLALERMQAEQNSRVEEAPKPKPKPEPERTVDETRDLEDDSPAARQIAALQAKLDQLTSAMTDVQKKEHERAAAAEAQSRVQARQRLMDNLAKEYGLNEADPLDRKMVEHRADDIANEAQMAGRVLTYDACYAQAKKEVGERLAKKDRDWLAAKKEAARTAAEPPGGVSAAALPATASLDRPMTREQSRKLAGEMEDGTVTQRALARFNRMMSAEVAEV